MKTPPNARTRARARITAQIGRGEEDKIHAYHGAGGGEELPLLVSRVALASAHADHLSYCVAPLYGFAPQVMRRQSDR